MSKDSLVKGTIILAVAALVARVLGIVQRVPLQHMLHDDGMGTFGIAYNIYSIMLIVATAGIPSAISKLVSERVELGRLDEANRYYRAAIYFAIFAGVLMTAIVYFSASSYAVYVKDEHAALSIRALAPALLFFPLIAIMRGYFQGRRSMIANGISQIVEQFARLLTAIGLAYLLLYRLDWGKAWAVAGASFGGVMGSIGALAVMIYAYMKLRRTDIHMGLRNNTSKGGTTPHSYKQIYKQIFMISVPIVLYSILVPLIYFIDSTFFKRVLVDQMSSSAAQDLLGVLTARAQSLAGIPIILAIALSQSIVPIVASAFARNDLDEVKSQAAKALRISVLSGLPIILFIVLAAQSLNEMLFTGDSGTGVIVALTTSTFFQILMQTSGAILMGLGRMRVLIIHVSIGILFKITGVYLLADWLGIYGFVASTGICFAVMTLLNLRVLRKLTGLRIFTLRNWLGLMLSTAFICLVGILLQNYGVLYINWFPSRVNHFIIASMIGLVVLALYLLLLAITRVVTKDDIAAFPAPLRKLIRRVETRFARNEQ
ncbi:MAG: polysaccharide biosynthesis protein [Paenibacillaceae bacterium]